ncbi:MAG: hypothetical protein ACOWWM_03275 [Desulfobacterales bacterium]
MKKVRDLSTIGMVVLFGVLLQLLLVSAEMKEAPDRAAVDFVKAYYRLDPAMADRICEKLLAAGNPVDNRIHLAAAEAKQRGFNINYMKSQLFHVQSTVLEKDVSNAKVRLVYERKKAIHPAFAYFAKMWKIGKTHHEDAVLELVLEEGRWKICDDGIFQRL